MAEDSDQPPIDALRAALLAQASQPDPPIPERPFLTADPRDYAQYIKPREALERLGLPINTAIVQLKRELEHGRLRAAADEVIWDYNEKREPCPRVPVWAWYFKELNAQDDFWDTGFLMSAFPSNSYTVDGSRTVSFFDVRFHPNDLPPPKSEKPDLHGVSDEPAEERKSSKGGRPAKPWWDELWSDIAAQLYLGGLKPSKLADIEKAMHEWVATRGDTVGETPIRKAAKLLWDAIQRED